MKLSLIQIGAEVTIGGGIKGHINGISILPGGAVRYQVAWWSDSVRYEQWLESHEVEETSDERRMAIE